MTRPAPKNILPRLFRSAIHKPLLLALGFVSLSELTPVESFARHHRSSNRRPTVVLPKLVVKGRIPGREVHNLPESRSAAAGTLMLAVQEFIAAGETNDVAQRTRYLASRVFFYGHNRTREQASKQMSYFNRWWPQRRYAAPESVDVYAIPNHPGTYKVISVYEYDMISHEQERMTGKARLTCIFEYGSEGPQIVGVSEKLLYETTRFYRDSDSIPVESDQETQLGQARITASR